MPKKSGSLSINLLPGKEPAFGEKFLTFSLTFGRYIIIGTEIVVLVAFLSRFKLDRDLIDLKDQIKEKQRILSTQKQIEEKVNNLQLRLWQIKLADAAGGSGILALPQIASLTPENITYKSITMNQDTITIIGFANETGDIYRFVDSLKSAGIFKQDTVSLEKIERTKPEETFLTFTITAVAKKGNN